MRTIEAMVNSSNSSFLIAAPLKIERDTKEVNITFIVYLAPQSQALYSLHFLAKRLTEVNRRNKKRPDVKSLGAVLFYGYSLV